MGTLSERTKAAVLNENYFYRKDVTLLRTQTEFEQQQLLNQSYAHPYALSSFKYAESGLQLSKAGQGKPSRIYLSKLVQFSRVKSEILEWGGTFRVNFKVKESMEQYVLFYALNRNTFLAAYMGRISENAMSLDLGD